MTKRQKVFVFKKFLDKEYGQVETFLNYEKEKQWQFLLAVILSAQTKDANVNKVTPILFEKYPSLEEIASADISDLARIIYPCGFSKSKSQYIKETAAILVKDYGSQIPKDRKKLMKLPGVGYKTSGVVLGELYNFPYIPVDTHVQNVAVKLKFVNKHSKPEETEKQLELLFNKFGNPINTHKQMILFGRNVCKKSTPSKECWDYIYSKL